MISRLIKIGDDKSALTRLIITFLLIMGIPYITIFSYFKLYLSASVMSFLYIISFLALYLEKTKRHTQSKITLIIGISLILLAYSFLLGSKTGAPLIFFPIISLPLILFKPTQVKEIVIGCCIPVACRFFYDLSLYFEPNIFYLFRENISPIPQFIIYEFAVFTSFLFTFSFIFFFYTYQSQFFILQHSKLFQDKEFRIAKEIQERLLPKSIPKVKGLRIDAISEAAHLVSGDFYEFFKINDSCIDVIMADIVGKGLPACLHMVAFKSILASVYDKQLSPKELMSKLNTAIFNDPVFKTYLPVIICRLDMNTNTLTYCNAGHEYSLLCHHTQIESLESTGPVLGVDKNDIFDQINYPFQIDDSFYMFTDGLTEAKNNFGEQFYKNLTQHELRKNNAKSLKRQVLEFSQHTLRDDLTIISVYRT